MSDIFTELETIRDTQGNPYWNIHPATARFLGDLLMEYRAKNILELGTSNGYSAIVIASTIKEWKGHLWAVESHKGRAHLAREHFVTAGVDQSITLLETHAPECLFIEPLIHERFDFVFIDLIKKQYLEVFKAVEPLLTHTAIVVFDNTDSHREELNEFREYVYSRQDLIIEEVHIDDGLIVVRHKH